MTLVRFHWTAWKPVLIARPRFALVAPPAAGEAKAPVPLQAQPPRPASARAHGVRLDGIASSNASQFQPAGKDDRPERYGSGQQKDAGTDRHRRRLDTRDAADDECQADDEPCHEIERQEAKQNGSDGVHSNIPGAVDSTTIPIKTRCCASRISS